MQFTLWHNLMFILNTQTRYGAALASKAKRKSLTYRFIKIHQVFVPYCSLMLSPVVLSQKWLTFNSYFTVPWGLNTSFECCTCFVGTQEIFFTFYMFPFLHIDVRYVDKWFNMFRYNVSGILRYISRDKFRGESNACTSNLVEPTILA